MSDKEREIIEALAKLPREQQEQVYWMALGASLATQSKEEVPA